MLKDYQMEMIKLYRFPSLKLSEACILEIYLS